jgi:murein DD-endopeptidase MepM/ murein hydrolase activator NlpD
MAAPGTIVGAPEAGVVMKWNPTGAQGGGSMYFRADSGKTYWLGHIANGLKPGTKVRRGQRIAIVSSDHPRPHVHMDVR